MLLLEPRFERWPEQPVQELRVQFRETVCPRRGPQGLRPLILLGLAVACMTAPSIVFAEGRPTLSVLGLESTIDGEQVASKVGEVLTELLVDVTAVEVVQRTDVTMGDLLLVHECDVDTPECLARVAAEFEAQQVLYGRVEPFADAVMVTLRVYDSARNELRPVYSREIPQERLEETLRRDLGDLLTGTMWELPAYLSLTADPVEDVIVAIDGNPVGRTPLTLTRIQPGPRVLSISSEGYQRWEKIVQFSSGTPVEFVATLTPVGASPPGNGTVVPPTDDLTYHPPLSGWVVLGFGGASLAGAIITGFLTLEAEEDLRIENRQRQASELRDKAEGLAITTNVLLGVGAAGVITGGLMLAFLGEWTVEEQPQLTLSPVRNGGVLGLTFLF